MNAYMVNLVDNGLAEHWPDYALAVIAPIVVWWIDRMFTRNDKRHERAENQFTEHRGILSAHETRITVLERFDSRNKKH